MTLFIDRVITSYYSEKMEIDFSDLDSECKDKKACFDKYKSFYINGAAPNDRKEKTIKIIFDKLYENSYTNILKRYKKDERPLILFPVMENDPTGDVYFSKNKVDFKDFKDYFAFIPVFSENTETKEEFTEKIDNAIIKIKENIANRYKSDEDQRRSGREFTPKSYIYTMKYR